MVNRLKIIANNVEHAVDTPQFERYFDRVIVGLFVVIVLCSVLI